MGKFKRISLNREMLVILIEAQMSKQPQCRGYRGWRIEAADPDEIGCNWNFSPGASGGCYDWIAPYIRLMRKNLSLDEKR